MTSEMSSRLASKLTGLVVKEPIRGHDAHLIKAGFKLTSGVAFAESDNSLTNLNFYILSLYFRLAPKYHRYVIPIFLHVAFTIENEAWRESILSKNRVAHSGNRDYCDLRIRQYGAKPTETGKCICHSDFR